MTKLGAFRSDTYTTARLAGDYQAIASGDPRRIVKRVIRKKAGRVFGSFLRRVVR